uniref:BED-type domain-containing protein n=1 Tax=Oryza punctata TaxID=4537 RepID=A0A0E0LZN8_ORYPU
MDAAITFTSFPFSPDASSLVRHLRRILSRRLDLSVDDVVAAHPATAAAAAESPMDQFGLYTGLSQTSQPMDSDKNPNILDTPVLDVGPSIISELIGTNRRALAQNIQVNETERFLDVPMARSEPQTRIADHVEGNNTTRISTTAIRDQPPDVIEVDSQSNASLTKKSPLKLLKNIKIKKRRTSRTTSDVWDHFTAKESEEGPVAVCNYCEKVYLCDRSIHGTSTLRKHIVNSCTTSPLWNKGKRRKLSFGGQEHGTPKPKYIEKTPLSVQFPLRTCIQVPRHKYIKNNSAVLSKWAFGPCGSERVVRKIGWVLAMDAAITFTSFPFSPDASSLVRHLRRILSRRLDLSVDDVVAAHPATAAAAAESPMDQFGLYTGLSQTSQPMDSDKNPNILDTPVLDVGPSIISELIGTNRRALAQNIQVNETERFLDVPMARSEPQTRIADHVEGNNTTRISTTAIRDQPPDVIEVDSQSNASLTKKSPLKLLKNIKIKKRRTSRTTSDVWDHFTAKESEEGPVAVCNYCEKVYLCDRSIHGTSTLRKHIVNSCTTSPLWNKGKRRKLSFGGQEHGTPKPKYIEKTPLSVQFPLRTCIQVPRHKYIKNNSAVLSKWAFGPCGSERTASARHGEDQKTLRTTRHRRRRHSPPYSSYCFPRGTRRLCFLTTPRFDLSVRSRLSALRPCCRTRPRPRSLAVRRNATEEITSGLGALCCSFQLCCVRSMSIAKRYVLRLFISLKYVTANVVDRQSGRVGVTASSVEKPLRDGLECGRTCNAKAAAAVGEVLAMRLKVDGLAREPIHADATKEVEKKGFKNRTKVWAILKALRDHGVNLRLDDDGNHRPHV